MSNLSKICATILLAATLSCDSGVGVFHLGTFRLVYSVRFDNNAYGLVVVDPVSSRWVRITPPTICAYSAVSVSPDGRTFLFNSDKCTNPWRSILRISQDERTPRPFLSDEVLNFDPVWDYTGSRVFFRSTRSSGYGIWTCDSRGGDVRRLLPDTLFGINFAPSPTSPKVAFASRLLQPPYFGPLGLYDYANGTLIWLTSDTLSLAFERFIWSPDGSMIVFEANHLTDGTGLYCVDSTGQNVTQLTHGIFATRPSWSPDGRTIAFYTPGYLMLLDLTTNKISTLVDLSTMQIDSWYPTFRWSPDSRSIAFAAGDTSRVWISDVKSGSLHRVVPIGLEEHTPSWITAW